MPCIDDNGVLRFWRGSCLNCIKNANNRANQNCAYQEKAQRAFFYCYEFHIVFYLLHPNFITKIKFNYLLWLCEQVLSNINNISDSELEKV